MQAIDMKQVWNYIISEYISIHCTDVLIYTANKLYPLNSKRVPRKIIGFAPMLKCVMSFNQSLRQSRKLVKLTCINVGT